MEKVLHPALRPYVIAAGLMILSLIELRRLNTEQAELANARETIRTREWQVTEDSERKGMADLRLAPLEARDTAYAQANIFVVWNPHLYQGIVTSHNLSAPPRGHDYQLWVLDPGEAAPVNAGLMQSLGGAQGFSVHPVSTAQVGFAVSLEPGGGSPEPTGSILFAVAPGQ